MTVYDSSDLFLFYITRTEKIINIPLYVLNMEQHKHCKVCNKPIPLDEEFCSEKCRKEYEDLVDSRKKRQYVLYALFIIFLIMLFLSFSGVL